MIKKDNRSRILKYMKDNQSSLFATLSVCIFFEHNQVCGGEWFFEETKVILRKEHTEQTI